MMSRTTALLGLFISPIPVASAAPPTSTVVPLYPAGAVDPLPVPEIREDTLGDGQINIRNVSIPTLEIFRPAPDKANGAAIIVAPGGGFVALVYENEGTSVAKRLAEHGITAFVLKYRVVQTPADPAEMMKQHMTDMGVVMARATSGVPVELPPFAGEDVAAKDAAHAVQMVRGRAAEWGIDPQRIGFLGFSAGAFLAADVAIGEAASRPDFVGLIYGGLRTPVPANAPPAFIATAADDEMLPNDPLLIYKAWKAAGSPAELHIYERGGHGFGKTAPSVSRHIWFDEFIWWMDKRELIAPAIPEPAK